MAVQRTMDRTASRKALAVINSMPVKSSTSGSRKLGTAASSFVAAVLPEAAPASVVAPTVVRSSRIFRSLTSMSENVHASTCLAQAPCVRSAAATNWRACRYCQDRCVEGSFCAHGEHSLGSASRLGDSVVRHIVAAPAEVLTRSRGAICPRTAAGLATSHESAGLEVGHACPSALRTCSAPAIGRDSRRRRCRGRVEWSRTGGNRASSV